MSFNNIKTNLRSENGFTIVELLIVIVVIGILAAITIVSFNGVTARANTANAQSAEESLLKKIEAYNAENSKYPLVLSSTVFSTANASTSYYLTGVTTNGAALTTSNLPANPSQINFNVCGTGATTAAPGSAANVTVSTGAQVGYWNYQTNAVVTVGTGTVSGTVNGSTIGCYIGS